MHRDRWFAVILTILSGVLFYLPLYWGLIKDLSDLLTQIISGGVLLLIAAAIGLWLKGGRESRKKREPIPKTRQQAFPAFQIGKKGHDIDIIGGELEGFDKVAEIGDESYKVRFKNVKARTKKKRFWFW